MAQEKARENCIMSSFMICTSGQMLLEWWHLEDDMAGNMEQKGEVLTECWWKHLMEREDLKDQGTIN
jgi:hypothetical protein